MAEAAKNTDKADKKAQSIIIKKVIKKGGGHHGGAWKVAYADFVTAMMAFFLLLWLLNVTSEEELNAISNYFDPSHPKVSESVSGAGGVMGGLSMAPKGAMTTNIQTISNPPPSQSVNKRTAEKNPTAQQDPNASSTSLEKAKEMLRKEEEKKFKEAEKQIKQAMESDPELKKLSKNLMIDMTPEGLRIQIIDTEGRPMFNIGSAEMFDYTKKLLQQVTKSILRLPNELSLRGHTDSAPYPPGAKYTNWELSSDRANSSRRVMLESDMPSDRINNVVGKADTDHLDVKDPKSTRNRRVSIILLKEELTNPDFEKKAAEVSKSIPDEKTINQPGPVGIPVGTFRRTQGKVEFP
jgi:chemotaxis protein MotB